MFKAISEQSYCMKIPVYIQETLSKFSKLKTQMERSYNCQVTNKDVSEKMNIEPEKIDTYLSAYTTTVSANYDAAPNYANSNIGNVGTYRIPAGTDTATGTITARSYYLSGYFPTKQYTPSALLSSDLITVGNTISAKTGFTKTFITGANQPADKTGLSLNTMQ